MPDTRQRLSTMTVFYYQGQTPDRTLTCMIVVEVAQNPARKI